MSTSQPPNAPPPAGWYPDPARGALRYWDGNSWGPFAPGGTGQAVPGGPNAPLPATAPAPKERNPVAQVAFIAAFVALILVYVGPDGLWQGVALGAAALAIFALFLPRRRRGFAWWTLVLCLLVSGAGSAHALSGSESATAPQREGTPVTGTAPARDTDAPASTRNVPDGFKDAGGKLAFRFVDGDGCDFYDRCSHVEVYAMEACPSMVYVEANVLDESGTVVSFTNDSVGGLRQGQTARLTLGIVGTDGVKVELTDMSCL